MRRIATLCLTAIALAACGDIATESALGPEDPSLARPGGYRIVQVKPDMPPQAVEAGAPVVSDLGDAMQRVMAGGTIRVFPGTYATDGVAIDKPVTIVGVGDGPAVLRTETGAYGLHVTAGVAVSLSDLAFENAGTNASVRVSAAGATLSVARSSFSVTDGGFAGLDFRNSGGGSTLVLEESTVTGGYYGVIGIAASVQVSGSDFSDQDGVSLYYTGAGTIEGNTMVRCGTAACIQAVGNASGTIAGNALSNGLTGPGPVDEGAGIPQWAFFHHVIWVSTPAGVDIRGNEIDGCGWGQCISVGFGGAALIEDNVITAYASEGTRIGIVAGDGQGGGSGNPDAAAHVVVRNNQLIGVGTITDRTNLNQYGFRIAALLVEGVGATLVAEDNTISHAHRGLQARAAGTLTGSGNVLERTRVGMAIFDGGTAMDVHGSDVTDYLSAIQQVDNTGSSLTCNYWGPSGPVGIWREGTTQGSSLYTPWSIDPIAATGQTTGCTGGESGGAL